MALVPQIQAMSALRRERAPNTSGSDNMQMLMQYLMMMDAQRAETERTNITAGSNVQASKIAADASKFMSEEATRRQGLAAESDIKLQKVIAGLNSDAATKQFAQQLAVVAAQSQLGVSRDLAINAVNASYAQQSANQSIAQNLMLRLKDLRNTTEVARTLQQLHNEYEQGTAITQAASQAAPHIANDITGTLVRHVKGGGASGAPAAPATDPGDAYAQRVANKWAGSKPTATPAEASGASGSSGTDLYGKIFATPSLAAIPHARSLASGFAALNNGTLSEKGKQDLVKLIGEAGGPSTVYGLFRGIQEAVNNIDGVPVDGESTGNTPANAALTNAAAAVGKDEGTTANAVLAKYGGTVGVFDKPELKAVLDSDPSKAAAIKEVRDQLVSVTRGIGLTGLPGYMQAKGQALDSMKRVLTVTPNPNAGKPGQPDTLPYNQDAMLAVLGRANQAQTGKPLHEFYADIGVEPARAANIIASNVKTPDQVFNEQYQHLLTLHPGALSPSATEGLVMDALAYTHGQALRHPETFGVIADSPQYTALMDGIEQQINERIPGWRAAHDQAAQFDREALVKNIAENTQATLNSAITGLYKPTEAAPQPMLKPLPTPTDTAAMMPGGMGGAPPTAPPKPLVTPFPTAQPQQPTQQPLGPRLQQPAAPQPPQPQPPAMLQKPEPQSPPSAGPAGPQASSEAGKYVFHFS